MDKSKRQTRLRVGICGGGIGGLTLAIALKKYSDIEVTIYEAASKLAEVGAGVGILPRPWEIIKELGLEDELLKVADGHRANGSSHIWLYRKGDGPEGKDLYALDAQGDVMLFHRSDFQQTLLRQLQTSECKIYCGKRLQSHVQPIQDSEPIKLLFEDGSTATCDVLIGADGLKSAVRRTLMDEMAQLAESAGKRAEAAEYLASIEPRWSGNIAYRALIDPDLLAATYPNHRAFHQQTQYLGKDRTVLVYPVSKGKLLNFVAGVARHDQENTKFPGEWFTIADKEEMACHFAGWEPEVQALLDCVDRPLRWAVHTVKPLSTFMHGRVAIMGDAAHAMLPHQGAGAGQAIEDAFILSAVLGSRKTNSTASSIRHALRIYDLVRRPRALDVQEKSRLNSKYLTFTSPDVDLAKLEGEELLKELVKLMKAVERNWEWAWLTSPKDAYEEATKLLEPRPIN